MPPQEGHLWYLATARELYKHTHSVLTSIGFIRSGTDRCIYTIGTRDDQLTLGVYVDDLTVMGKKRERSDAVKVAIRKAYSLKDLGIAKYLLGISFERSQDGKYTTIHKNSMPLRCW